MAFLVEAYTEDEAPNAKGGVDTRTVLRLDPRLAPVKAAVLPLSRNADLSPKARDLAAALRRNWNVDFDEDWKSTPLNSSHANISSAVFCLKKQSPCYLRLACCFSV